jgi:hypothetical protein
VLYNLYIIHNHPRVRYLKEKSLPEYARLFEKKQFDGLTLQLLTAEDLNEAGWPEESINKRKLLKLASGLI